MNPVRQSLLVTSALILLSGCATLTALMNPVAPNEVAALETALTIADRIAVQYTDLPACGSAGATALCEVPATKAAIKAKGLAAYNAVKALEASSASGAPLALSVAQAAMAAYQAVIPAASTTN